MRQRGGTGKPAKLLRRKVAGPKQRKPAGRERGQTPSVAKLQESLVQAQEQVARLTRELSEAREQQTASSEVLRVISSSSGALAPVFQALLENATRICGAKFGATYLYEEGAFRFIAHHNGPPAWLELRRREPVIRPAPGTGLGNIVATKHVYHIADVRTEPGYLAGHAVSVTGANLAGFRTLLAVPLLKDDELIGSFNIYRQEVQPFTDKQVELVQNFAAQAVIAIENTRLLAELRESLDRQTATSDVLAVISASPGELQPVFETMLEHAMRLCEADGGGVLRVEGRNFIRVAGRSKTAHLLIPGEIVYEPGTAPQVMVETRRTFHAPDFASYIAQIPETVSGRRALESGVRSLIWVPMVKDDEVIAAFVLQRYEMRAFTEAQIALVESFADQAVIAIENTRLLNELRQRTDDLSEALEQQTATSEVLGVISSCPGELEPVFQAMLSNATRICDAQFGTLFLYRDGKFHPAVMQGAPPEYAEFHRKRGSFPPIAGHTLDRLVRTKKVVHVLDSAAEAPRSAVSRFGGARTHVAVPMLKEGELVGAIVIYRQDVRPFTDKQVELVSNFAAQAVIAIENTRLLNELRQRTEELSQRTDDLSEALEQQTATSEVLKVISSSPGDLKPVFEAMLANATRICGANFGNLLLGDGDSLLVAAMHGARPEWIELRQRQPVIRPGPYSPLRRAIITRQFQHIEDLRSERDYVEDQPSITALVNVAGARSFVAVPMLKDNEPIGLIAIYRQEVHPFTEKQIALVQNFAAQAVIAIENTRLLNELRQRTDDLTESLEQQTATSEVLQVISSSPGELERVFEAMLANAVRICDAKFGGLFQMEGEAFRAVAHHGAPAALLEQQQRVPLVDPVPGSALGRLAATRQAIQIKDVRSEPAYQKDPTRRALINTAGARTLLAVPMLKDNELVGAINIYRQEVRPFTDKQIALVQNFAAQAVIAIENTRLLNELRQRTDDLSEALEQQTATSEVLQVISSSPGELEPVFVAMLTNAVRLCESKFGIMYLYDGSGFHLAAVHNTPSELADYQRNRGSFQPRPGSPLARLLQTKEVARTADDAAASDPTAAARLGGARSHMAVPMIKDDELVGAIVIYRTEVRPFTDRQIELVQNFAAQAVIAIENARLLNELRESLQQQTATADVLKVISRSTFDLQRVLETLLESAVRLCGVKHGMIFRYDGEACRAVAAYNTPSEYLGLWERTPIRAGRGTATGRALLEHRPVQVLDVLADPEYEFHESQKVMGYRTVLSVPLLREGIPLGTIGLMNTEVEPFTDKQIELVTTFADQAVIAIENVRLFDEIQDKSRQLAEASEHKSQFLANMSHELRTPLNAILGYTELIADGVYGEPTEKMVSVLKRLESNGKHLLGLINAVLDLSKIEAGRLVLDLADYSMTDVVQTVCTAVETLAADKKLALKVQASMDLPAGRGDERRLTQVLLNLVGNAIKFTDAGEVVITATARNGSFNVSVKDTGPGISQADQAKLFQEFQQADSSLTRKKGGTGLGLAISKRIIEMHGGRIWIDSVVGQGSTFSFALPVRVEQQVELE